jgi:hypothetical protein
MSIIRATTTISVLRSSTSSGSDDIDRELDSYGDVEGGVATTTQAQRVVARGVRANIGNPGGTEAILGGNQETMSYRLQCDPVDLLPTDQIKDEKSGLLYDVVTSVQRSAFAGREYTQATLSRTRGAA